MSHSLHLVWVRAGLPKPGFNPQADPWKGLQVNETRARALRERQRQGAKKRPCAREARQQHVEYDGVHTESRTRLYRMYVWLMEGISAASGHTGVSVMLLD